MITQAELDADRKAEQAMAEHAAFLRKHENFFSAYGRVHPVTGLPLVEDRPALRREAGRLHAAAAEANRVALQLEYDNRRNA